MCRLMLRFAAAVLLMGFALSACLITSEEVEVFHRTYQVQPGADLSVFNPSTEVSEGDVTVTAWEHDYVDVYAVKRTKQGRRVLEKVEIEVNVDGSMVVSTRSTEDRALVVAVSYDIKVPESMTVSVVETSDGSIHLQGTKGDVWLKAAEGDIVATGVDGTVSAETAYATIRLTGTAGIATVTNHHGDIEAEVWSVGTGGYGGGDARIETTDGSIRLYLYMGLDAAVGLTISPNVTGGELHFHDVDLADLVVEDIKNQRFAHGVLGDGSGRISVSTSNGDIDLYRLG